MNCGDLMRMLLAVYLFPVWVIEWCEWVLSRRVLEMLTPIYR